LLRILGFDMILSQGSRIGKVLTNTTFNVRSLFVSGEDGFIYDPSVLSSMSQDTAGSTPVTTIGQSVGRVLDLSGNAINATQATAANRPLYARAPVGGIRNMLPNSTSAGAILGIVGSGGVLPTEWGVNSAGGLTTQVMTIGSDIDGFSAVAVKISGIPSAAAYNIRFANSTLVPAVQNQTWTASFYAEVIAGTTTNISAAQVLINEENSSSVSTGTDLTPFTLGARTRAVGSHTLTGATTAGVENLLRLALTIGLAIDVTILISAPQLEQGATATAVQTVASRADITEVGKASRFALRDDQVNDTMTATLPAGTYTVAYGDDAGVTITTGVVHGGGSYTIPGPARAYGIVAVNRALTSPETAKLTSWLNSKRP